jgi:hypothetical protein
MSRPREFDRDLAKRIYFDALALDVSPRRALCEVLDISPNSARYIVYTLKLDGHLGRAPHLPYRVVIRRKTFREKSWLVCEECTTTWPCRYAYPPEPVSRPVEQSSPAP